MGAEKEGSYGPIVAMKLKNKVFQGSSDVISMNYMKVLEGCGGTVVFEVYDDTGSEVEEHLQEMFSEGNTEMTFWYGYANGTTSDKYKAIITKVSEQFISTSMMLTIEAIPSNIAKAILNDADSKYYTGTPSMVVYEVAREEGWRIDTLIATDGDPNQKFYRQKGQNAIEFINTCVSPYAVSTDGDGQYQLYVEDVGNETRMKYFPKGYIKSKTSIMFTIGETSEKVIGWYPDTAPFLGAMKGASGLSITTVDPDTNEKVQTTVVNNDGIGYTKIQPTFSSANSVNNQALAQNTVEELSSWVGGATIMLKGDPQFEVGSVIKVKAYTKKGKKHPSSGEYMITGVEELIQDGEYTTELTLVGGAKCNMTTTTIVTPNGGTSTGFAGFGGVGTPGSYEKGQLIGTFECTAYCSCKICCGQYSPEVTGRPSTTASGTHPTPGWTIAVDTSRIPMGSYVMIDNHVYHAEDTGSAIKGNRIDVYFNDHEEAKRWGRQTKEVYAAEAITSTGKKSDVVISPEVPKNAVVEACKQFLGIPYVWGGKNPSSGLDCSGFACALINSMGGHISGGTADLVHAGTDVGGLANAQPGDLVVRRSGGSGHVQVYVGNGWVCEAPHSGDVVKFNKVMGSYTSVRRVM